MSWRMLGDREPWYLAPTQGAEAEGAEIWGLPRAEDF